MTTCLPPWNSHDISNHLALIFKVRDFCFMVKVQHEIENRTGFDFFKASYVCFIDTVKQWCEIDRKYRTGFDFLRSVIFVLSVKFSMEQGLFGQVLMAMELMKFQIIRYRFFKVTFMLYQQNLVCKRVQKWQPVI